MASSTASRRWTGVARIRCLHAFLLLALLVPASVRALIITEIMYHSEEADDRPFEWIEIYNENADPVDLSGYSLCNAVTLEIPVGTWLEAKSFLVLCANAANVSNKHGVDNVLGDWFTIPATSPSLANSGERIEICNPGGKTITEVRFNDRGKWPAAADGTGHSLALVSFWSEIDDPDSWALSLELGGTPGAPNGFTDEGGTSTPPPAGMDGSGFITKWLALGPYTGAACAMGVRLTRDWLRESAGGALETGLLWSKGQVVNTNYVLADSDGLHPNAGTALPTIKEYSGFTDTIDLNEVVYPPNPENVMSYSFVYVDNVTASPLLVDLACASDDAISILVNGVYAHSNDACRGVGGPGEVQDRAPATLAVGKNLIAVKVFEEGGGWSFRLRFEERGTGVPITSKAKIQITTDRTKGLNFGGGGTPIEPPTDPPPPPPGEGPEEFPVIINEGFFLTAGDRWIELYNQGEATVNLGGYFITDDPADLTKAQLPAGTTMGPGAYRSYTETELGLSFAVPTIGSRVFVALVDPTGPRVVGAYNFEPHFDGYSEARVPGDDRLFSDACDPTRDALNAISVNADIVLNEIMYHPLDGDGRKEYVELYNRGAVALDLTGWSLSDGLNFDIPPGTVIGAGGYLVIARDPSLFTGPASIYGLPASLVLGPTTPEATEALGVLRDRGERLTLSDQLGRTVDTVRFHDGGEWPRWADGGGSSLELIDARQDNRHGQAWDASDDSAKSTAQTYSYIARHGNRESELALALLAAGITVVDDVSIVGGGVTVSDTPLIAAGETWRYFKGTVEPPANWRTVGFADGSWLSGATGIGYGDNDDATELLDMQGAYVTIYCRKAFNVADRNAIDELVLSVVIDDGFYAYLNGTPVAEYNVTSPAFDAAAPGALEPAPVDIDISAFKNLLVNGTNVLAIQVHNAGAGSSDLSFNPRLVDRTTTVGGGSEQLTNGTFNSSTAGWVIEGTHIRSGRTTVSPITGAGSLKVIAAGRGDNKVNRIETPDAGGTGMNALTANQDVQISLKARWMVGAQTLLTNGYDHEMARAHSLDVPLDLGTPGARNQVTQRLIAQTGASNLGPVITDVSNDPVVPSAGTSVKIRARVVDADGVGAVQVRYALNNPSSTPTSVTLTRVAGTDFFEGTIPGQTAATRVVHHITATDAGGRAARYPADITQRSHPMLLNPSVAGLNDQRYCIYRHDVASPATPYQNYRMWMTQANQDELSNRRLQSNDPVEGSFVFGSSHMYHQASTRFGGSPFARAGWGGSFRVRLPRDKPLHGRLRRFGLESHHGSGVDARERISHYLIRQQNQGAVPVPYSDTFILVRWQVNDATSGVREHYWVPDGDFVSLWFPGDDEGDMFEMDDRFVFNDSGGMAGNADGRVLYPPPYGTNDSNGDNKENYRYFHGLRAKNGADEYANFIAWAKVMDPSRTNDATFDQQIWDYMNVEEMLRMWAVEMNIDDWDSWGMSRGKNCYLYRGELDGRFNLMAWDLELTYGGTGSFLIPSTATEAFNPGGFGEVNRLMNRPKIRRMYYSILDEMVNGPDRWFHSSYLDEYASRLAALGMTSTGIAQPGGFIDQRAALLQPRIQAVVYPQVRLAITTSGGNNFSTAQVIVNLQGTAPTEVSEMVITNGGDGGTMYSPNYSSMTNWTISGIPLVPGANALTIFGMDLRGNVIDTDTITVTSTAVWNTPVITSLNPAAAAIGQDIEILGTDFHDGVRVFFGAVESTLVTYDEDGPTPGRIVARVPSGAGTVNVTVRNLDSKTSNARPFTYTAAPPSFIRGDANGDGVVDLADAVRVVVHLFAGVAIDCEDALDADDTESLNVTDAIRILDYLFRSGAAPPAPFPAAGTDPSGAALGCER